MPELFIALIIFAGLAFMASSLQSVDVTSAAGITVTTAAETLAAIGTATSVEAATCKCAVRAFVLLTVGASTTAVTLTIYRGAAIGGPIVGTVTAQSGNFTAAGTAGFTIEATDPLANAGQAQYCVSVKQTGATGNGTIVGATITTMVLSG